MEGLTESFRAPVQRLLHGGAAYPPIARVVRREYVQTLRRPAMPTR